MSVVFLCLLAVAVPIASIAISGIWSWARREQALVDLKRSMVERGMTVDEIERVIDAGNECHPHRHPAAERAIATAKSPAWANRQNGLD